LWVDNYKIRNFDLMMKALVGGDCYHTINPLLKIKSWFADLSYIGAMAIAPYGVFLC